MKIRFKSLLLMVVGINLLSIAHASVVDDRLQAYRAEGAGNFSAKAGEAMWFKDYPDPEKPGKVRNCTTCHGQDLTLPSKHVKTGKAIKPLAPSANPERLTDAKFIEKWFKRNCKWVLQRECTPQEKGDFLMYLRNK